MSLKERIQQEMKEALRSKNQKRLNIIRLLMAAIKQREVDERITLDDIQTLIVIDKMIKQRRESLTQYKNAGRQDLADQEAYEIEVLQTYLPSPLSSEELDSLIKQAIEEAQATEMKDMGKVMAILKPKIQGRADISEVSTKIKAMLQ